MKSRSSLHPFLSFLEKAQGKAFTKSELKSQFDSLSQGKKGSLSNRKRGSRFSLRKKAVARRGGSPAFYELLDQLLAWQFLVKKGAKYSLAKEKFERIGTASLSPSGHIFVASGLKLGKGQDILLRHRERSQIWPPILEGDLLRVQIVHYEPSKHTKEFRFIAEF